MRNTKTVPAAELDLLKMREGFCATTYLDTRGNLTGGYGHLLTADEAERYPRGTALPPLQTHVWLSDDARTAWRAARRQADMLNNRKLAGPLFHVCYQLGQNWHREHRKTWAHLMAGDYEAAAIEAANSRWYEQTPRRVMDFQERLRDETAFDRFVFDPGIERAG